MLLVVIYYVICVSGRENICLVMGNFRKQIVPIMKRHPFPAERNFGDGSPLAFALPFSLTNKVLTTIGRGLIGILTVPLMRISRLTGGHCRRMVLRHRSIFLISTDAAGKLRKNSTGCFQEHFFQEYSLSNDQPLRRHRKIVKKYELDSW